MVNFYPGRLAELGRVDAVRRRAMGDCGLIFDRHGHKCRNLRRFRRDLGASRRARYVATGRAFRERFERYGEADNVVKVRVVEVDL